MELFIDRVIPNASVSSDALVVALKGALGNKCDGIKSSKGKLYVILTNDATADDQNTATAICMSHDFSTRTAEQTIQTAAEVSRSQVMAYLRQQLTAASPNVVGAKTQVENYINQNPKLQTALTNIASLYSYDTGTNAGYLRAALILIALMS